MTLQNPSTKNHADPEGCPNPETNNWYVYILRCKDDSLYTGITTDPARRVNEHNGSGKNGARYTRARQPVEMVYQESCKDRSGASRREYEIKQLNRREKQALIKNALTQTVSINHSEQG